MCLYECERERVDDDYYFFYYKRGDKGETDLKKSYSLPKMA